MKKKFFWTTLIEEIPDLSDAKQCYQSYLKKENAKMVKPSRIITQQSKTQILLT